MTNNTTCGVLRRNFAIPPEEPEAAEAWQGFNMGKPSVPFDPDSLRVNKEKEK